LVCQIVVLRKRRAVNLLKCEVFRWIADEFSLKAATGGGKIGMDRVLRD
jgi:hypothetical protein